MNNDRTRAAAIAAVLAYLQTEEEAVLMAAVNAQKSQLRKNNPTASINFWGMTGRQDMMQMRSLMQLKAMTRIHR